MLSQYYQDGYPITEKIDNPDWVSNKKTPDVPKKIRVPIPGQFGTADPKLVQRLKDSKALNYANFPDMETDDVSARRRVRVPAPSRSHSPRPRPRPRPHPHPHPSPKP